MSTGKCSLFDVLTPGKIGFKLAAAEVASNKTLVCAEAVDNRCRDSRWRVVLVVMIAVAGQSGQWEAEDGFVEALGFRMRVLYF